jgi:Histidine kinase-like ATPase domain
MEHTQARANGLPERPLEAEGRSPPRRSQLSGGAASLRDARRLVAATLAEDAPELRDVATLLTGELVTNAILHGGGSFLLQVDADEDLLRVEVTDSSAGEPLLHQPSSDREHGRGMAIVDALATNWGSDRTGIHKVVWFEIRL